MKAFVLSQDKSYTFSDFFEMTYPTKDIVAEFGYGFLLKKLQIPKASYEGKSDRLKNSFYKKLPYITLNSEMAKREILIAPILLELLDYIEANLDIEYPVNVNEHLKGSIDYLIRSSGNLLVVEAKKADMDRGFTQLAVEMIAADRFIESNNELIYGAVTIGDIWKFGILYRKEKQIYKDIDSFRIPSDMDELFSTLIGILKQ